MTLRFRASAGRLRKSETPLHRVSAMGRGFRFRAGPPLRWLTGGASRCEIWRKAFVAGGSLLAAFGISCSDAGSGRRCFCGDAEGGVAAMFLPRRRMRWRGRGPLARFGWRSWRRRGGFRPAGRPRIASFLPAGRPRIASFRPPARLRVSAFRPRGRHRGIGRLLLITFFCVILLPLALPLIKLAIVLLFAIGTLAAFLLLLAMIRFLWLWWR